MEELFELGCPKKREKSKILRKLINNISTELNTSFARIKSRGFTIE
jgi:hypothetical protein